MHRLIRIDRMALMEVLGSVERCSPDPRRNTSKTFFEASRSGNKAATCCSSVATLFHLVATLLQLCCHSRSSSSADWKQSGNVSQLRSDLTSVKAVGYYGW